jgi:hypothetical protein
VGVFWYLWYGYNYSSSTWTGGNATTSHWSDSPVGEVVDRPLLGYYASLSNYTVGWQVEEMKTKTARINFAVISWWGWGITNFSNPGLLDQRAESIDNATLNVFKYMEAHDSNDFKLAIMVDAFNSNNSGQFTKMSGTNYTAIYNYVWNHFYSKYSNIVMNFEGKPLLFWFIPLDPYPDSSRDAYASTSSPNTSSFTNVVVGNSQYVNLTLWQALNSTYEGSQGINAIAYEGNNPSISSKGIVSITPRYDDYYLYLDRGRSSYMRFDVSYNESLYQQQWNYVLSHASSIRMVLIYSWNEYHERSEIEPHYDNTSLAVSGYDPFYLLNLTNYYTAKLNNISNPQPTSFGVDVSKFTFNDSTAASFFLSLNTPTGLLMEYPGSKTIYLADDQALDCYALQKLYQYTENSRTLSLANQISESSQRYGGLFKFWNAAFVLLGDYPTRWNFTSGHDIPIENTTDGYQIRATTFSNFMGEGDYTKYADLELYFALYNLHSGNFSQAEKAFEIGNSYWDGNGFTDAAFNKSSRSYASYKLAIDVIVWKALLNNSSTREFALEYSPVIQQAASVMSLLQSSSGGVWTDYKVSGGEVLVGSSQENGETTSLFILAE